MTELTSTVTRTTGGEQVHCQEVAVSDSEWTPVVAGHDCLSVLVGLRTGAAWHLFPVGSGSSYKTIRGDINLDMASSAGDILFYARSASGSDTLEVMELS